MINQNQRAVNARPMNASSKQTEGIPVVINDRTCGFIMPNGDFFKRLEGSRHFHQKLNGIGFNLDALSQAERLGATRVRIRDAETSIEYFAPLSAIREHGIPFSHRVFGKQIVLPFKFWLKHMPDGQIIQPAAHQPQASDVEQLNLFGGNE